MEDNISPQNKLRELLFKIPSARNTGGNRGVAIRCPYCGDSKKNPNSAHLGINLGYDNTPQFFNCFKCHASGIINHKVLLSWGLFDNDTFMAISTYNKKVLSMEKNMKYNDRVVYRLNNNYISDNDLSRAKLNYINKRLNLNLTYDDLLKLKIVLNVFDVLQSNNINKITRDSNLVNQLDESFLGFISQDNAFLNLRNLRKPGCVDKPIDKRYVNYNIFGKFTNTERYYTIPTNVDLCRPERIKLHIAEGPFDILSIYHNLRNKENHAIFTSILGSSYVNICKYFISNMSLINIEVHIYIDNDVSYNVIRELSNLLKVYQIPFYLHRNMKEGEKDFGVSPDRIKEQIQRIP